MKYAFLPCSVLAKTLSPIKNFVFLALGVLLTGLASMSVAATPRIEIGVGPALTPAPLSGETIESPSRSVDTPERATGRRRIPFYPRKQHAAFSSNIVIPPGSLPTFTRSFVWRNRIYREQIVGSDPAGPEKTTTIKTLVVPLRLDFGNGEVRDADHDQVDGKTVLADVLGSPIFNNASFSCGPTFIGDLQYADAFQRANFWTELRNKPGYHLLLQPLTAPSHTIVVPPDKVLFTFKDIIVVDPFWFDAQIQALIPQLGAKPDQLIIFLPGHDVDEGAGGYHEVFGNPPFGGVGDPVKLPAQTYMISNSYSSTDSFAAEPASVILSHEIIEWENDPYLNNEVPAWEFGDYPGDSSDILEACDPFEFLSGAFPVLVGGNTYYIFEAGFFDYFTRAPVSRSVNGWYSFHNVVDSFSMSAPTDNDRFVEQDIDYPGADNTYATAINNRGDIAGLYHYAYPNNAFHGFLYSDGVFKPIDVPGAFDTFVQGINDFGQITGYFDDNVGNHGFTWKAGHFTIVDYSSVSDTFLSQINDLGQVAGGFDPHDGSPGFGFVFDRGQFRIVQPPFGIDSTVTGINNRGDLVGNYDNQNPNDAFGFIKIGASFYHLDFPAATATYLDAMNDRNEVVGGLYDVYGFLTGFYKQGNDWLHVLYGDQYTILYGINDRGQAVGNYRDSTMGHGLILTPIRSGH